jgi:anti-sigma regulatory factor (Ser/Thr protein kinase)/predicted ArsR family transcriptional regulator
MAYVDWYFDATDPAAMRALRSDLRRYLERHAEPGSDLDAAEIVAGELLANVTRHAVGPAWVSVDWSKEAPLLAVHDLGPGFELEDVGASPTLSEHGYGLTIVSHLAQKLEVRRKQAGGARVTVELPVRRRREVRVRDVGPVEGALPTPEEATPEGAFSREPFLRALVVQLSRAVEEEHGPDAAEHAVTRVGLAVGGRMEEEYRKANGIVGQLTPEQIADLFVKLKAAIEGGFYVIEANEDRVVLGNTRCPFGEVVQRSPSLCRMTSSVFGGIAARNTGGSSVQLEERIAVGDPGCRVTVLLGPRDDAPPGSQEYDEAGT